MVMVSLVMNGIGMMMMGLTKHPELALVILILQKGDQTVTLKVTDTYGQTDTVTKTVSVGEQTNNDATQGSIWIEDETLHWVNGNTEYWIRGDPNKIAEAGLASDLLDATSSAVSFQSSFSETPYVFRYYSDDIWKPKSISSTYLVC